MRGRRLLLIKNHRAEKMHRRVLATKHVFRKLSFNVLPQRLPLLIEIPNILTLKQRDFETHLSLEDFQQGNGIRFHLLFSSQVPVISGMESFPLSIEVLHGLPRIC